MTQFNIKDYIKERGKKFNERFEECVVAGLKSDSWNWELVGEDLEQFLEDSLNELAELLEKSVVVKELENGDKYDNGKGDVDFDFASDGFNQAIKEVKANWKKVRE